MPTFEKPISELWNYLGINPRPADFDSYWDSSLAELAAADPQVELRPNAVVSSKMAECFDLWFTGVGGARVHAKYLRPRGATAPGPAVVVFHGYSGGCGEWSDKLAYISQGISIAALDCRGQGGSSEDVGGVKGTTYRGHIVRGLEDPDPKKLLFRSIFLDCAQLAGILMSFPEVDPARVGATGGSQGGALTLACAALEPRIKLAAPVDPFLCDYRRTWEMDLFKDAYEELRIFSGASIRGTSAKTRFSPGSATSIATSRPANPGRDSDADQLDGHGLPALHPVRRLQQDPVEENPGLVSGFRPRAAAGSKRPDPEFHARALKPVQWDSRGTSCPRVPRRKSRSQPSSA